MPANLDACGGHVGVVESAGRPFYHYHASSQHPFTIGCFSGCLDLQTLQPVNLELAAVIENCAPAEKQPNFEGFRSADPWVSEPVVSETGLLLSGNYEGSVSIVVTCPIYPGGLSFLRFSTNGQDPTVGGAEGEGFALGTIRIIVSEMAAVRARCEAPNMEPSSVLKTNQITVVSVAYNPHWAATMGFWNLTDNTTFVGSFAEPRSYIQGGCPEVHGTQISPAYVRDLSSSMGQLLMVPPDCKAGVEEWDVAQQPSIFSIHGEHRGIKGVLLDDSIAINGLQLRGASVQQLVDTHKLPSEQLTVEVWAALMAGSEGAFAGVIFRASGFLGRGWYLGWESDTSASHPSQHTVTFVLTLSTEGTDTFGRGGLGSVRATFSKLEVGQRWVHVAGTYDGRDLSVYVNGTLAATERACKRAFCGRITYPVRDSSYVLNDLYFGIGAVVLDGRQVRHQGYVALLRILGTAIGPSEIRAAAERLNLPLALAWCPLGTYGPYDGLRPCIPCQAGYQAPLQGQTHCEPCPAGYYADTPGSDNCKQCPNGLLTVREGSANMSACTGPDLCRSALHNCDTFAVCESTEGSFECLCLPGFVGDGLDCAATCGDGLRVYGEHVSLYF